MKKTISLLLALLMVLSTAACGGGGGKTSGEPETVKGETYNAGSVSALVPNGWKAFGAVDQWAEKEGTMKPDYIQIGKGAKEDFDLFSKPSVNIQYYDESTDMIVPDKSFYEETKDVADIELGGRIWSGYTGKSMGAPLMLLWTGEAGGDQFQVVIWMDMGDGTISVEDADVQAIIASIAAS